ncbi:hypothetical protein K432DRAFT_423125 [Lepidopterella palustris CBS 459.81]|uniref:Uncharacterized protein n=1 Tax=Lepidopterella palustris CBS 459.81 TaxID=1314670 RepID=A0A8E2EGW1_9PEZI|nr:hypothetical protein K432DRAFT_423125 [Lepidopterella palustris CBS 459.81]
MSYQPPFTLHDELRMMYEWIHLERPFQRLRFTLDNLSVGVLQEGLRHLRRLISSSIAKDLALQRAWRAQLAKHQYTEQGFAYAGWSWHAPPEEAVERLERSALMTFLLIDASIYDAVSDSVWRWEKEVDARQQRQCLNVEDGIWEEDDSNMDVMAR